MLVRTRGGARPSTWKSILQREQINVEVKQRIAQLAASMIADEDTVMMEAGTTAATVGASTPSRGGAATAKWSAPGWSPSEA